MTGDAWDPGIQSKIPSELEPAITLYQRENSAVDYQRAGELADFSGLSRAELVLFTVERLVAHELLVRVTSDLSVPDGPNYEDLGINLRSMVSTINSRYVLPSISPIQSLYDERVVAAKDFISRQLKQSLFASKKSDNRTPKRTLLDRLTGKKKPVIRVATPSESLEINALAQWRSQLSQEDDSERKFCLGALIKVVDSLVAHRGKVLNNSELIVEIATNYAANSIGAELVSESLDELFRDAVIKESYCFLPLQTKPVVMNVKGASASGKSTIRPQQRALADKLGIQWEDFALISPDYWRKYLLDYDSLADNYKYAAMLTGQELEIIDKKLDHYMARKANDGEIPHLLIDRFRFDSFSVDNGRSQDSKLLSRFGDRIYMFFMITPPAETVVRAWERGQTTGRYKAVDDLLYHNIEAFTGIPALFLSWVMSVDKRIHFEFLDNSVEKGQLPRTAAFGWNNSMTIFDVELMRDIDRFRKVNVDAKNAEDVLLDSDGTHTEFLSSCIKKIHEVKIADPTSGQIHIAYEKGNIAQVSKNCPVELSSVVGVPAQSEQYSSGIDAERESVIDIDREKKFTIGHWSRS